MGSFAEQVIRSFEAGRRARLEEQEQARREKLEELAQQDRKAQMEHLKVMEQIAKATKAMQDRAQAVGEVHALSGLPNPPPVQIPELPGRPGMVVQPPSAEQLRQQKLADVTAETQAKQDVTSKAPLTPFQMAEIAKDIKIAQIHAGATALSRQGQEIDPGVALDLAKAVRQRRMKFTDLGKTEVKLAVQEAMTKAGWEVPRALTAAETAAMDSAPNGIGAVLDMEDLLKRYGSKLLYADATAPGFVGRAGGAMTGLPISEFRTARQEAIDIKLRIRTGAQVNENEWKMYKSFAPQAGDSPEAIDYKLRQLKAFYYGMQGAPLILTNPKTGEQIEAGDMFKPATRGHVRKFIMDGWVPSTAE